jgi:hypothetical protein
MYTYCDTNEKRKARSPRSCFLFGVWCSHLIINQQKIRNQKSLSQSSFYNPSLPFNKGYQVDSIIMSSDMLSYFPGGAPQSHLFCSHCSQHFMVCSCTGLSHGQGTYYVLPRTPDSMPKTQRLERFTVLMQFHPLLQMVDMSRFLNDAGGLQAVVSKIDTVQPILVRLMEAYKTSTEFTEGVPMKDMDANGLKQCRTDCDLAVHNFGECHWGQIKLFEWLMLNNAVQTQCNPEDFSGSSLAAMKFAMDVISMMSEAYNRLKVGGGQGSHLFNYQLEDVTG